MEHISKPINRIIKDIKTRFYSPGASINGDYAYGCDNCETNDGRPTLVWTEENLGDGRYFSICFECLAKLYTEHIEPDAPILDPIEVRRAYIPESLRNEIYERDSYKCQYCGDSDYLELDHKIPFSRGGKTNKQNLITSCRLCNRKKGASMP